MLSSSLGTQRCSVLLGCRAMFARILCTERWKVLEAQGTTRDPATPISTWLDSYGTDPEYPSRRVRRITLRAYYQASQPCVKHIPIYNNGGKSRTRGDIRRSGPVITLLDRRTDHQYLLLSLPPPILSFLLVVLYYYSRSLKPKRPLWRRGLALQPCWHTPRGTV